MRRVRSRLGRLTLADYWSLGRAYLYLLRAGWQLFVRHQRIDRWAQPSAIEEAVALTPAQRSALCRKARWVNFAARHTWPQARCLQRSLALCLWLERQGWQPRLQIGVRKQGAALEAHAWVEQGGEVINDRLAVTSRFMRLSTFRPEAIREWRKAI